MSETEANRQAALLAYEQAHLTGILDGLLSRQPLPSWVVNILLKHGWHRDEEKPRGEKGEGDGSGEEALPI